MKEGCVGEEKVEMALWLTCARRRACCGEGPIGAVIAPLEGVGAPPKGSPSGSLTLLRRHLGHSG